ncbi:putative hydrolase of the HAD superfamily [Spinactinospora alkalitolerans]|uniref:Putative hydrolase of the HAD superfamily n=1 Tax=Spinactinospora alkalitolerans TaxID=687207 RepID=A0A852TRM4_9ACTN|nr:HAD family hydrolase [Spinactinospora alkalitolerans]NYE46195.1 putative hydrolase of the HAD superfamily [Spinactinospora alkalitolerans]
MQRLNLVFGADDVLWEDNALFERAIEVFIDHLAHPTLTPEQVREVLNDAELANFATYGHGAGVFERSLTDCLARLRPNAPPGEADRAVLREACAPIRERAIGLLDGVPETLRALGERHRLFLIGRGDPAVQEAKIEASGLAPVFESIGVVREKDPATYRAFAQNHGLEPADTWVIGNSVRSDAWPALEAGMGAVLIPHQAPRASDGVDPPEEHDRFHTVSHLGKLTEFFT